MLLIDFKMSTSVNTITEMKAILEMVGYIKLVIFAHRASTMVLWEARFEMSAKGVFWRCHFIIHIETTPAAAAR